MSEFLAKTKAALIMGICVVVLGVYWFADRKKDTQELQQKLEQLECVNDSLLEVNSSLDTFIHELNVRRDSLEVEVALSRKQLSNLKQAAHEKMAAIDSFSVDELERFFADYPDK